MEAFCRLCAVLKQPDEFKCKIDDTHFDIERKLITCCNWNSFRSHKNLTKNVCIQCFLQLEQCWYFRESVSRAQQKLFESIHNTLEPNSLHQFDNTGDEFIDVKVENTLTDTIEINHIEVSDVKVENDFEQYVSDNENYNDNYNDSDNNIDNESEADNSVIQLNLGETSSKPKITNEKVKRKKLASKNKQNNVNEQKNFNISKLLNDEDMNEDGTIKAEKILEQNLSSWTDITHLCYKCKEQFNTHADLWLHFTANHQNEKLKYICPICPNEILFLSERYYRDHVAKLHHPHLAYCCHRCQKFFHDHNKMRKHLKSHPRDPTCSVCKICGKGFSYYKNLHFHMLGHLPAPYQPQYECYLCKKMLKSFSSLRAHVKYHIGIIKSLVCEQCGKVYKTSSKLKEHLSTHSDERPFTCEHCSKTFKTMAILRRHTKIHLSDRIYICDVCGHSTIDKQRLKNHVTRYHTNDSPFPCDICNKPFYKIQTLNTHQKKVHFNTNPFPCDLCEYRAVNERALKRHHKHIHANPHPHKCNFCEYSSYSKFNLQMHISRRHGQLNDQKSKPPSADCD